MDIGLFTSQIHLKAAKSIISKIDYFNDLFIVKVSLFIQKVSFEIYNQFFHYTSQIQLFAMSTTNYTYTYGAKSCQSDTFLNTCASKCCFAYSGSLGGEMTLCTPSKVVAHGFDYCAPNQFLNLNVTSWAVSCTTDSYGNGCYDKCCIKSSVLGLSNFTTCTQKPFCQGININSYSSQNLKQYAQAVGVTLQIDETPKISSGGIGGLAFLSVFCAIMIGVLIFLVFKWRNLSPSPQLPKMPSQNIQMSNTLGIK